MTLPQSTGTEGWQRDPFGRHELRFFDGHKWTPYVRDGERNGLDEPVGPTVDAPALRGSRLLDEETLVVEYPDHGRRRADRAVHAGDGRTVGTLRTATPGARPATFRALVARDQFKGDALELLDDREHLVFTLLRPIGDARGTLVVRDAEGREAGRISQQSVRGGATTYSLLGPNSAFLGDVQAEDWEVWDLRVLDSRGRQVATVNRDWTGLDLAAMTRPRDYVVRIAQPVPEPLRTLVVAAAVGLDPKV